MCMLTVLPMPDLDNGKLEDRLYNGAMSNPHGHGWAVVVDGQIRTGKSMDAGKAIDGFLDTYRLATGPALFHSRWATHGPKTLTNVHPFPVRKMANTYLAHNGILPSEALPGKGDKRSDTRVFAEDILPIKYTQLDSPKVRASLDKWLGHNKIAVLTTNRRFARNLYLFNMELGDFVDGVWFSNSDHEPYDERWSEWRFGLRGLTDPKAEPCVFCGSANVTAWGTCQECNSCQDCFEHVNDCLCYSGSTSNAVSSVLGYPRPDEGEVS